MTARISVAGALRVHGREAEIIIKPRWSDEDLEAASDLMGAPVRITIEPDPPPAPGDALDYLAELKGTLNALVSCHAEAQDDARDRVLRRALRLANTASNALLAERRAAR